MRKSNLLPTRRFWLGFGLLCILVRTSVRAASDQTPLIPRWEFRLDLTFATEGNDLSMRFELDPGHPPKTTSVVLSVDEECLNRCPDTARLDDKRFRVSGAAIQRLVQDFQVEVASNREGPTLSELRRIVHTRAVVPFVRPELHLLASARQAYIPRWDKLVPFYLEAKSLFPKVLRSELGEAVAPCLSEVQESRRAALLESFRRSQLYREYQGR